MGRSKRKSSDQNEQSNVKKTKDTALTGFVTETSIFSDLLAQAGLILRSTGMRHDRLLKEQSIFERDLTLILKRHIDYPQIIDKFVDDFSKHIEDVNRLHGSLLPTFTPEDSEVSVAGCTQNSLVRLLLAVDLLQPRVMTVLLEKLAELTDDEEVIFDECEKVNLPRLIMTQFRWLDRIVDAKALLEKMFEVLSVTSVDVQREIVTCIPEVVDDTQHADVARQLRNILVEQPALTAIVLDSLSNLNLKHDLVLEVQHTVVQSLPSASLDDLPTMVKFLLQTVTPANAIEVITQLRLHLDLDCGLALNTTSKQPNPRATNRGGELLTLDAIHSAIRFQRMVADAWLKVIESVQSAAEYKSADLLVLFVLHAAGHHKAVDSLVRAKVRASRFTLTLVEMTFSRHTQAVCEYSVAVLAISQTLLRSVQPAVSHFASSLYRHAFLTFDSYGQQEIVGSLVTHIGSGVRSEVRASLDILVLLVENSVSKMAPFAVFIKGVFDYLEHLSVSEIRKLYYMLSVLAFKTAQRDALLQDEMYIIIRKQLSNNNPKYKRMGVIGAVMVVQNSASIGAGVPPADSSTTAGDTAATGIMDGAYRQATGLLQQLQLSTRSSPPTTALLMDELANVIQRARLDSKIEAWINDNLLNDFQDDFVIDVDVSKRNENEANLQFGLDEVGDGAIAINLFPLVKKGGQTSNNTVSRSQERTVSVLSLAPHFRLLQVCESREHNADLEGIDALLGCPVHLPDLSLADKLSSLSLKERQQFSDTLFIACNWFIEIINAFSSQSDAEMKAKVITRIGNLATLWSLLEKCIADCCAVHAAVPGYQPPLANFDSDISKPPTPATAAAKTKKPTAKGRKRKKNAEKDTSLENVDDESRDSTQLEKETQCGEVTPKDQPASVNLLQYRQYLREFDMHVFGMLKVSFITKSVLDSDMNTRDETTLQIQPADLHLLLADLALKLHHILIASETRRPSFLKLRTEASGFSHLDELGAERVVRTVVALLPALCDHLEATNAFFQSLMVANDGLLDGPWGCNEETNLMSSCHALLLQVFLAVFSWTGFSLSEQRLLLKEALSVLASRMHQTSALSQNTLDVLFKHSFSYLESFAGSVLRLPTALSLCQLLTCLAEKSDSPQLLTKIGGLCEGMVKREWLTDDGERGKGAKHNEHIHTLLRLYMRHSDDVLSLLEELAAVGVPELLQNSEKNGSSQTFPTLTKNSYPVFYKLMLEQLVETVKTLTVSKQPGSDTSGRELLMQWNLAVRIFHILVNLVKAFDARPNLCTVLKYGRLFLELFVRNAMPVLDDLFRQCRDDIQALLKNLQLSTRCLHHLCGHSKIIKDVSLTSQVPLMKRCLEAFVYRVKVMLTMNKCSDAFWLGNLKNRDLQGEEILSQAVDAGSDDSDDEDDDDSRQEKRADAEENASEDESCSETY